MFELVKVTALYSNAVLMAILPHVSDFAQRAELRTNPIVPSEINVFHCDPRKGQIGGHFYLTNGWHFWFGWGHAYGFETRRSYFSLQDPDLIPRFYGPVNVTAEEALAFGKRIISQLKGTAIDEILARPPKITGPIRLSDGVVPRYRIEWPRADAPTNWAGGLGREIDLEIDASDGTIQSLSLSSTNFFQPTPKVDIVPEPLPRPPAPPPLAGTRMPPVSAAYSNAFLTAILPAFTDFARKLELPIRLPITPSMIRAGPYTGIYQPGGLPEAQIELTNGIMFTFQHGHVRVFACLYDTFFNPVNTNLHDHFVGPINMTEAEVYDLARETIRKLGYTEKDIPDFRYKPSGWMVPPGQTNGFARVNVTWWPHQKPADPDLDPVIEMEIDTTTRSVKSLCIREPKLWRDPPQIAAPPDAPIRLARLISTADHIICTNSIDAGTPKAGLTISGAKARRIVNAVSSARRLQVGTDSIWDLELRFYRTTNCLATIRFQGKVFLAENGEFADRTGQLERLYKEALRLAHRDE